MASLGARSRAAYQTLMSNMVHESWNKLRIWIVVFRMIEDGPDLIADRER